MSVCSASAGDMGTSRFIGLVFLTLSLVLLSHEMAVESTDDPSTGFLCPLMDYTEIVNGTLIHNINRTVKCVNGRKMAGCCVTRIFCDFNTSHIDLSVYGPPGFRMSCSDVCCPQKYILPIPLQSNTTDSSKDDDHDSSNVSNNNDDSNSDEN